MLLEVVLPLEGLAARLAREGDVVLVRALMDHEVVRLSEAALAVLADELAFGAHLTAELGPPLVRLHLHDGEHGAGRLQQGEDTHCQCALQTGTRLRGSSCQFKF